MSTSAGSGAATPPTALSTEGKTTMVVNFQSSGGFAHFPGLSRPVRIDTADLAPEQAEKLNGLVEGARFFEQPAEVGAPPQGAADLRSYTITVQDGDRTHTVQTSDALEDPGLRDLVEHLRAHQRAQV